MAPLRIAVLYGGRSGEHEISLMSAASVIRNLDPERFEVVPIGIDRAGRWHAGDARATIDAARSGGPLPPIADAAPTVVLPPTPSGADRGAALISAQPNVPVPIPPVDVVFPVMHGPLCEDGTIQGLLELADVAYVGCGVLASAVGMDKEVAKRLARDAGLPIVPFVTVRLDQWLRDRDAVRSQIVVKLGFPLFIKPVNMGSSVGVRKVSDDSGLDAALDDAFRYDTKVLAEQAVHAREIEVAVLESRTPGEPPMVSTVGEINPTHEFYSYEAKYVDESGAELIIPADITPEQHEEAKRIAREIFVALECQGMARVDMFLDVITGALIFNEVNTIPGFTRISMYPKLWEASGLAYADLLSHLVDLALARHARRRKLLREYHPPA